MTSPRIHLESSLGRLWAASPALTAAGLFMIVALFGSLVGLLADPRLITGAPAWLKPAKFAVSTAIYMLTLAWIFTLLPDWPRMRRVVGWVTAVILVMEVAIIDAQAWRGTSSHFNVSTVVDGVLFSIMGLAIVVQTLTSVAVAIALWRQRFDDRALGWALRLGLVVTIIGASTGGLMTRPTPAQLEQARATGRITTAGAHTVGAADGGPGLPGTGWSVEHGDLRIPHFIGLHAMQILPLLALALRRRSTGITRVRLVFVAASSYTGLFAILLWQALRGQSVVRPDGLTIAVLAVWAILTAVCAWVAAVRQASAPHQAAAIA
jgi:energy-converting hydrogenase Eha subunit F